MKNKKFSFLAICIFIIAFMFFLIKPYHDFLTKTLHISLIKTLLAWDSPKTYDNNVSLLILGIAGGTNEGTNLSDSILVLNYNLKTNKLLTISIPRDIWSETMRDKINTAFAYGEAKQKGGGLKLAKAEVSAIVGIPITYASVINFNQFKELIDLLGGVDVEVERAFEDKKYPIEGREDDTCSGDFEYKCRYQTVSFKKGLIHMDGKKALEFTRSRNAIGPEGNDFARSKRQQRILDSLKKKLLQELKTLDLKRLTKLYNSLDKLVSRDITNQHVAIMAKNIFFAPNFFQKEIELTEDFFNVPSYKDYDGKYVLIPNDDTFLQIKKYVQCYIKTLDENRSFDSCEVLKKE